MTLLSIFQFDCHFICKDSTSHELSLKMNACFNTFGTFVRHIRPCITYCNHVSVVMLTPTSAIRTAQEGFPPAWCTGSLYKTFEACVFGRSFSRCTGCPFVINLVQPGYLDDDNLTVFESHTPYCCPVILFECKELSGSSLAVKWVGGTLEFSYGFEHCMTPISNPFIQTWVLGALDQHSPVTIEISG